MIGSIILIAIAVIAAIFRYLIFPPQRRQKRPLRSESEAATKPAAAADAQLPPVTAPPYLPLRFVVFDLETTGLDAKHDEIIEIGAIRVTTTSSHHKTLQMLVRPLKPIPRHITRITGISQAMVDADGVTLQEAVASFAGFIGDLPLVSYNAQFDMAFLEQSAARCNVRIQNPATCALKMARRAWPFRESYRLSDIARDAKLSCDDAHRALGDCKRTMMVYAAAASVLQVNN